MFRVFSAFMLMLSILAKERTMVWKDGVALWSDAYEKDNGSPKILDNIGVALNIPGDRPEALEMLDRALARKKDHDEAYYNRGLVKYYLGRHMEAIDDYSRAIALCPTMAVAWHDRAGTCFTIGSADLAMPDALKAVALGYPVDPKFIEVHRSTAPGDPTAHQVREQRLTGQDEEHPR